MEKESLNLFLEHKSSLMALAYRMLGTISEAEDIVQETYLRWQACDRSVIKNPKGWLITVCSRIALDSLQKAYKKREVYTGPWLPEPNIDSYGYIHDVGLNANLDISIAFLLLLETLKPVERAIYLLREAFDYSFAEIAQIVEKSEENCRKIAQRARKHIIDNKPKFDTPSSKDLKIIEQFFEDLKTLDPGKIKDKFIEHPEFWSDGGGKVVAIPKVMTDPLTITRFFKALVRQNLHSNNYNMELSKINSGFGVVISKRQLDQTWMIETILNFEFINSKIARIYGIRNPDKLKVYLG